MFGFACDETPDLMPATLDYSHKILMEMAADRHSGAAPFLEPDAKSQVTLRFEDGKPAKATAIVVSTQHAPGYDRGEKQAELHAYVKAVVARVLADRVARQRDRLSHQPDRQLRDRRPRRRRRRSPAARSSSTPMAARLRMAAALSRARTRPRSTARPLMRRATSPRTSSRPALPSAARSSSLMRSACREPLSLYVDTHGTGTVDDAKLEDAIRRIDKLGRLTPRGIRTHLGLNKPIYQATAAYGHFGRSPKATCFPWERLDLVDDLKAGAGVEALPVEA